MAPHPPSAAVARAAPSSWPVPPTFQSTTEPCGTCPAHPSAPSQERARVPCSTPGTQREQVECHPGQQREITAPCPALGGEERLGAKIGSPGKGHTWELAWRGETSMDIGGSWQVGARHERERRVTEGSWAQHTIATDCRYGNGDQEQTPAHPRGATPLSPGRCQERRSPAGSPGIQVKNLLGQVAGAPEQRPDLQGGEVEGEAAGGVRQGLPGEQQNPGTERQQQERGAHRPPAAGLRDPRAPRGAPLPRTRLPAHLRRHRGCTARPQRTRQRLLLSSAVGAVRADQGDACARRSLSAPLGRFPGASPLCPNEIGRTEPGCSPRSQTAPQPQGCRCSGRTHVPSRWFLPSGQLGLLQRLLHPEPVRRARCWSRGWSCRRGAQESENERSSGSSGQSVACQGSPTQGIREVSAHRKHRRWWLH